MTRDNLPHWSQKDRTCFVTWRTADSIPQVKILQWRMELAEWEHEHGLFMEAMRERRRTRNGAAASPPPRERESTEGPFNFRGGEDAPAPFEIEPSEGPFNFRGGEDAPAPFEIEPSEGPFNFRGGEDAPAPRVISSAEYARLLHEYRELREGRLQRYLDAGYGACVLARADLREIVERAILHFDLVRYAVYSFVVMPNHVHALLMPLGDRNAGEIIQAWKSVSAHALNRVLRTRGSFWQDESFDHFVRGPEAFERYRAYIRENNAEIAYDACAGVDFWKESVA